MRISAGHMRLSASDEANFVACRHLTCLDLARTRGEVEAPRYFDLGFQDLVRRGEAHEAAVLEAVRGKGLKVVEIGAGPGDEQAAAAATREALANGAEVIYQGVLLAHESGVGPELLGRPDFLVRADLLPAPDGEPRPERIGHEVVDAKLARTAKARAVLQVALYSHLLAGFQEQVPRFMHLALGNGELASYKVGSVAAYERQVRRLLAGFLAEDHGSHPIADPYPEAVEHCAICRWAPICRDRRREDDDLSLVAGLGRRQRLELKEAGIPTRRALAALEELPTLDRTTPDALARAHLQARLQVQSEDQGHIAYELLDPERGDDDALVPNRGLLTLPEPVEGDLFFDIEGSRYYTEGGKETGLQYLFGIVDTADRDEAGHPHYRQLWAFDRAGEKAAFEELVDLITERLEAHPGLHVYHYSHYEPTAVDHLSEAHETRTEAVGRLMGRFATREDEVDDLFRAGVFVDLYRVIRQGVRAGVESYSIKALEPLVGYHRQVGLGDATEALIGLEAALEDGGANDAREIRAVVAGYNEDDCRATLALRDWLEARRGDLAARLGEDLPRPQPPAEPEARERPEVVAVKEALCAGVPEDPSARTSEEAARALLADLLEWHRREAKPAWWRYFHVRTLSDAELVGEPDALGGLVGGEVVDEVMRSVVRRFSFPPQEHGFARGDTAVDPVTGRTFEVWAISNDTGIVLLKMAKSYRGPLPTALVEGRPVDTAPLAAALLELGRRVATEGVTGADAATALLGRHRPTGEGVGPGPLQGEGESATDAAVRLTLGLRGSYLPIQGPPGTGKTFTGAKQILALLDAGRSVGITGPSHAVINHMIAEVLKRASDQREATPRIGQRAEDDNPFLHPGAEGMSNEALAGALVSGEIQVGAGTAWLWSRPDLADSVDTLFVDEAGQLSLANVLAVAGAGANLVLLGDPQQLAQPSQAAHPPGAGVSALEHVLGDRATMPEAAGLFMDRTRRMHPDLCTYTSQAFYDSRLGWVQGLEHQAILGEGALSGSGIRVVEVPHDGNANQSPEEAEAVAGIAADLLGRKWRNAKGISPLTAGDILIVTPYNAQIRAIEEVLREGGIDGVQVGTVDKFQGRQAPVVLYSMASSSAEEAPRGMEFLYDPHRLNVATSRAQALAIIVASPEVPRAQCRTPRHMQLANALCRAWELDSSTTVASSSRSRPRKVRPAREVWAERFGKK